MKSEVEKRMPAVRAMNIVVQWELKALQAPAAGV
jgi:hypothetical protein